MSKFEVGDYVAFEDVVMDDVLKGRILVVTATEFAVAVPGWGVQWVKKTEVMEL